MYLSIFNDALYSIDYVTSDDRKTSERLITMYIECRVNSLI